MSFHGIHGLQILGVDELVDDASGLGWLTVQGGLLVLVLVVAQTLPVLHGVGTFDYFFLESPVILLELSQGLFLLVGVDQRFVVFMFILLPVDCLKVAFFCISLLDVEFLLELEIVDLGVHFDDVVPEDFFLVEGLLYFADG